MPLAAVSQFSTSHLNEAFPNRHWGGGAHQRPWASRQGWDRPATQVPELDSSVYLSRKLRLATFCLGDLSLLITPSLDVKGLKTVENQVASLRDVVIESFEGWTKEMAGE